MTTVAKEHRDILIAQVCSQNSSLRQVSWRCNEDGVSFKNPDFLRKIPFFLQKIPKIPDTKKKSRTAKKIQENRD
jgi:hypothetical protein